MLGDRKDRWLTARMEDLDYGDIDGIYKAARAYRHTGAKEDEVDTALGGPLGQSVIAGREPGTVAAGVLPGRIPPARPCSPCCTGCRRGDSR